MYHNITAIHVAQPVNKQDTGTNEVFVETSIKLAFDVAAQDPDFDLRISGSMRSCVHFSRSVIANKAINLVNANTRSL
jgi:hypothetical protein